MGYILPTRILRKVYGGLDYWLARQELVDAERTIRTREIDLEQRQQALNEERAELTHLRDALAAARIRVEAMPRAQLVLDR